MKARTTLAAMLNRPSSPLRDVRFLPSHDLFASDGHVDLRLNIGISLPDHFDLELWTGDREKRLIAITRMLASRKIAHIKFSNCSRQPITSESDSRK